MTNMRYASTLIDEMWLLFMKEYNTEIDAVRHLVIEKSNQTEKSIFQDYLWSFQNFKFIQNAPISPWSTGLRRKMHSYKFPVGASFENNNSPIKYFVGFSSQSSQNY